MPLQGKHKRKSQIELNREIEAFIMEKDFRRDSFSKEDIAFINQYEGYGGQASKGAKGQGVLYEYYTPDYICEIIYKLALFHGYKGGNVLEPSVGTGRIVAPFPDKKTITGFETNTTACRIAQINYPEAEIHNGYFETAFLEAPRFTTRINKQKLTWLKAYPFSLVIGNPPFGRYQNQYSSHFRTPKIPQVEIFFIYYGLQLLKKGGLLIYLLNTNFLRTGIKYEKQKNLIGEIADIVDAYRLPPVFKNTDATFDILVLKKL